MLIREIFLRTRFHFNAGYPIVGQCDLHKTGSHQLSIFKKKGDISWWRLIENNKSTSLDFILYHDHGKSTTKIQFYAANSIRFKVQRTGRHRERFQIFFINLPQNLWYENNENIISIILKPKFLLLNSSKTIKLIARTLILWVTDERESYQESQLSAHSYAFRNITSIEKKYFFLDFTKQTESRASIMSPTNIKFSAPHWQR